MTGPNTVRRVVTAQTKDGRNIFAVDDEVEQHFGGLAPPSGNHG